MEQTISKPLLKDQFESMGIKDKLFLEEESAKSLRSEASRWNSYTSRRYRVLQDENKKIYIYRES